MGFEGVAGEGGLGKKSSKRSFLKSEEKRTGCAPPIRGHRSIRGKGPLRSVSFGLCFVVLLSSPWKHPADNGEA